MLAPGVNFDEKYLSEQSNPYFLKTTLSSETSVLQSVIRMMISIGTYKRPCPANAISKQTPL